VVELRLAGIRGVDYYAATIISVLWKAAKSNPVDALKYEQIYT
jgi:hypothetical protein